MLFYFYVVKVIVFGNCECKISMVICVVGKVFGGLNLVNCVYFMMCWLVFNFVYVSKLIINYDGVFSWENMKMNYFFIFLKCFLLVLDNFCYIKYIVLGLCVRKLNICKLV